ncbi:unnamed protein product [Closterium sp. NIES-65]|nr:unnamed protein product [Closterium sp. NIES-65]
MFPKTRVFDARLTRVALLLLVGAIVAYGGAPCEPSSLRGFTNSVDLSGNGLVLHWARNASHLQLALEAKPASGAESGWFSQKLAVVHSLTPTPCTTPLSRVSSSLVLHWARNAPHLQFGLEAKPASGAESGWFSQKLAVVHSLTPTPCTAPLSRVSSSLVLHWARNASHLQFALEAKPASGAESGWFSVGWTANRGRMYPADCVIGNLPGSSVRAYRISGYSRFSRFRGDGGTVPVSFSGSSSLIWAFSESGSTELAFHGDNAGSMNVDFSCASAPSSSQGGGGGGGGGIGDNDAGMGGGDDDDDDDDDDAYDNDDRDEGDFERGGDDGGDDNEEGDEKDYGRWKERHNDKDDDDGNDVMDDGNDNDDIKRGEDGDNDGDNDDDDDDDDDDEDEDERYGKEGNGSSNGDGDGDGDKEDVESGDDDDADQYDDRFGEVDNDGDDDDDAHKEENGGNQSLASTFILHWKTGADTIAMAADVATSGWVAVGWSSSGKMYPADAAIGNLPRGTLANGAAVGAYHLSGYGLSDVALTSSFELTNTSATTANGRTTITSGAWALSLLPFIRIVYPQPLSPILNSLAASSDPSQWEPSPSAAAAPPACSGPSLALTRSNWTTTGQMSEWAKLKGGAYPFCVRKVSDMLAWVSTSVLWAFSRSDSQQLDDHGPNE